METTQGQASAQYPADPNGGQRPVVDSPATSQGQGRSFDCRILFFTLRLGIVLNALAYRDVIAQGSGRLCRLLSQIKANLPEQACDISPIEAIVINKLSDRHSFLTWMLQHLQFTYQHPINTPLPADLIPRPTYDRCISIWVDLHTVAHFFEIERLQQFTAACVSTQITTLFTRFFLISTVGSPGSAQFKQPNIPGMLEQTADAIARAARVVPATSGLWVRTARFFLTMRHVTDFLDGGHRVMQQILRLNHIGPFAHALVRAELFCQSAGLEGVFQTSMDWNLQHADCACTGCSNIIWRGDLVKRTSAEIASGAVQKFALVNPYDGFKTVFCDFCSRRCGVPWDNGNKPCVPHE
ncbi:hypothetical protein INS49_008772 [Diaporthe citri]|uniref:uncharacterized protein n=1 Tax=Diaporthe citri TaxID=83186 RepID=UPI001C7F29ED|nr:uncharacterized protein INS49_008772 [Diaporthe citri]KAG6363671.1 hypothetical protein INS49_008772 [Diaporthe citri]